MLVELFTTAEAESRHQDLVTRAEKAGVPVFRVGGEVMAELAQTVTPQGLLAVCAFVDAPLEAALSPAPRLVTVLAHVRDPGNAGTVLRTADAAGSDSVIFTDASVDPYNGKCVRASAGSLFHLPVVVGPRFDTVVPALKEAGLTIVAADGAGTRSLDDALDSGALAGPTAWVFGNEAWGLPDEILQRRRRGRQRPDLRRRGEPQPGHRRGRLPLHERARPACRCGTGWRDRLVQGGVNSSVAEGRRGMGSWCSCSLSMASSLFRRVGRVRSRRPPGARGTRREQLWADAMRVRLAADRAGGARCRRRARPRGRAGRNWSSHAHLRASTCGSSGTSGPRPG